MSRTVYILLVIGLNIAADQITKFLVRTKLNYREQIPLIGKTDGDGAKFILTHVENEGAFLGMGSDLNQTLKILLLWVLPVAVLAYVIHYILTNKSLDKWSLFAFCCIIGGGIANVFDRIAFGKVTDFLYMSLGGPLKTGIFNIADLAVTTGLIILILSNFLIRKKASE